MCDRATGRAIPICLVTAILLATALGASSSQTQKAAAPDTNQFGLERLFEPGVILQDRNADGVIDFVNARLVLDKAASPSDVAAASNVAARLGFETSAMDLPLNGASSNERPGVAIVIGLDAFKSFDMRSRGMPIVRPGEGVIRTFAVGSARGVLLAGGDERGTSAAAAAVSQRLPYLTHGGSGTLRSVVEEVKTFLTNGGASVANASVPELRVPSDSPALSELTVSVQLQSEAEARKAETLLRGLVARNSDRSAAGPNSSGRNSKDPHRLLFDGVRRLVVQLAAPATRETQIVLPGLVSASTPALGPRPTSNSKSQLDLSNLYTPEGLLGDSNNDLIPDRIDTVLNSWGSGLNGLVNVAARLGLESTGVSLPVATLPQELSAGTDSCPPASSVVLVGSDHPVVKRLAVQDKVATSLRSGEGVIQVVPNALCDKPAVIVAGGDDNGTARALEQLAERFPHVWARGKDRTTIADIEEDVRRFLSGRSPAGQAASALYKLDRLLSRIAGKELESLTVDISIENADDKLEQFVRNFITARTKPGALDVRIENRNIQKAPDILREALTLPSEVEDFWQAFRTQVIPEVRKRKGQPVTIEARLSEPPAVRTEIADKARTELLQAGAVELGTRVVVLSAYKQGYSWLTEVVQPALLHKDVEQIVIRFAESVPPTEWPQQVMNAPARWLQELFPIEEVLARDLGIKVSQIRFEKTAPGSPTYEVLATGPSGAQIYRDTFEPKVVLRPFFDQFPNYEKVRVSTGWISATIGGATLVDKRIITDLERFWDYYQTQTLPALYRHVMAVHKGNPRPEDAPYFGELVLDVSLSEPDYLIGIDQEQIAPMDSLHEEIWFSTIHFFDLLGRFTGGRDLAFPGRIVPILRPTADGKPGHLKVELTAFHAPRPMVSLNYRQRGGASGNYTLDIPRIDLKTPSARSAVVQTGQEGLERLDVWVDVDTQHDERDELVGRFSEREVDGRIVSADQVKALLDNLVRLRSQRMYLSELAYQQLKQLRIAPHVRTDPEKQAEFVAVTPNGVAAPWPDITSLLPAGDRESNDVKVQWEEPIPPSEAYGILAKMSKYPQAHVYKAGTSYLGQDIWAMDLTTPVEASHWSQAKATTLKPTVVYSARQHANEVSSTSHVLKLAEQLLTDADYRKLLDKVNVVIHPVTNPDGAQLAADLAKITPNYRLKAGYFGALATDVSTGQGERDPMYPEAKVRPQLWRTWLPDIFNNPHGYPSHEHNQIFTEYVGEVRTRSGSRGGWWGMRGWFIPSFNYIDDPRYPRHKAAAFEIRQRIAAAINSSPDVRNLNERAYARYQRYAVFDPDNKFDLFNGVLIYSALKGATPNPNGTDFMTRYPNVTIWEGHTEAPDETAHADWMHLVATAGLLWDKAILQYLADGDHVVERERDPFLGGVRLSLYRPRPPKNPAGQQTK